MLQVGYIVSWFSFLKIIAVLRYQQIACHKCSSKFKPNGAIIFDARNLSTVLKRVWQIVSKILKYLRDIEKTKETKIKVLWLYWHGKKENMKYLWTGLRITKSHADCVYSVPALLNKDPPSP